MSCVSPAFACGPDTDLIPQQPLAGRTLIRDRLTKAGTKLSFLELQANHAFIRCVSLHHALCGEI